MRKNAEQSAAHARELQLPLSEEDTDAQKGALHRHLTNAGDAGADTRRGTRVCGVRQETGTAGKIGRL